MAKYTPGPWQANGSLIKGPRMALLVASVKVPGRGLTHATVEEQFANARLIAAAPEMLAALANLVEVVQSAIDSGLLVSATGKKPEIIALDVARAAIAKAEAA